MLLFQSFFHQPVFQHISDFHLICFGKGEMAVAAYADVGQAHNAGIAAVAVDTVGEGLRHTYGCVQSTAVMPSAGCLPRCNRRAGSRTGRFKRAAFRPQNLQRLRKSWQPASARGGNRNAAAGEIGAVGDAGSEAERGVILRVQVA